MTCELSLLLPVISNTYSCQNQCHGAKWSLQVEGSSDEEDGQESPGRILAAFSMHSPARSWSARQRAHRASLSPQSLRQVGMT